MKKKYYIITAVASYFIFLIATIPAKPITDLINNNSKINMRGISGTIWHGKAYLITINGNTELKNTRWSFKAWKLFIGQLAYDINSRYLNNDIEAEIGSSFFSNYFINDLNTTIAANNIAQLANIPLLQLSGNVLINIEHAQWKQGELPLATGIINWNNAILTVADRVSLGNVTITLGESEQQTLLADLKNTGGDITVSGTAKLVPEANYAIDLTLSPTSSASNNIKQGLGMFAKRQVNGDYLIKKSGPLKQMGMM